LKNEKNSFEAIKSLVENKSHVNFLNIEDNNPFFKACKYQSFQVIKYLIGRKEIKYKEKIKKKKKF
jgi:ankyrin repeat protein